MRGIPRQRKWLASLLVSLSTAELQAQIDWKYPENNLITRFSIAGGFLDISARPTYKPPQTRGVRNGWQAKPLTLTLTTSARDLTARSAFRWETTLRPSFLPER